MLSLPAKIILFLVVNVYVDFCIHIISQLLGSIKWKIDSNLNENIIIAWSTSIEKQMWHF